MYDLKTGCAKKSHCSVQDEPINMFKILTGTEIHHKVHQEVPSIVAEDPHSQLVAWRLTTHQSKKNSTSKMLETILRQD